jgi:2-polyprenyl-3-methyl-5-hydroxy-6-metoxy-1,4-benzoquinol methylase
LNNQKTKDVFNWSGLAALNDLQTELCQNIFSVLEEQQTEFLNNASEFRSEEYKWPNDPLHCWSRGWEYPYVYYHLARYVKDLTEEGQRSIIADIGSGVTFFPFSLAQLGCEVICSDIDPVCETDILRARESVSYSPGNVHFRLINNEKLPFNDGECDAVYCVSVIEHIPDFENTVREMARILKLGGLCLITCDLDLDSAGNKQLNTGQFERLVSVVGQEFSLVYPERTIHPVAVLTNRNSPYSGNRSSYTRFGCQLIKQKILKPLLGKKSGYVNVLGPSPLAILGLVLQKRR